VRRRSPLFLGIVGTIVALLAAVAAGAIVHAVAGTSPSEPKPEVTLHFDKSDDESGTDDLIGGDATGKAAPTTSFALLDGGRSSLAALHGTPVVLNFWATTCAPCIREMPAIESVHKALGDRVTFVGIDVRDSVSGGQEFVKRTGVTYTIGRDPSGDIFTSFDAVNLPTTVLIDAGGTIVATHTGALDEAKLRSMIDSKLLG
jgi:thiol-disulfide isomerase/thioredoxin